MMMECRLQGTETDDLSHRSLSLCFPESLLLKLLREDDMLVGDMDAAADDQEDRPEADDKEDKTKKKKSKKSKRPALDPTR